MSEIPEKAVKAARMIIARFMARADVAQGLADEAALEVLTAALPHLASVQPQPSNLASFPQDRNTKVVDGKLVRVREITPEELQPSPPKAPAPVVDGHCPWCMGPIERPQPSEDDEERARLFFEWPDSIDRLACAFADARSAARAAALDECEAIIREILQEEEHDPHGEGHHALRDAIERIAALNRGPVAEESGE